MKEWLARSLGIAVLALVSSQGASAAAVTVDDVVGNSGDSVTVGLFVDGYSLAELPTGLFGFDLEVALDFDPNLTITSVTAGSVAPTSAEGFFWPTDPRPAPNVVGFNAGYNDDPGPLSNAEMLRLTFSIGAGAPAGPFPVSVSQLVQNANATVIPLPPAIWLFGGALALMSVFRRRHG